MTLRSIGTVEHNCKRFGVENFANIPADILEIGVCVNPRLRTTFGKACQDRLTGRRWIEIHKCVFVNPEQMRDTLAHEIAHHWAGLAAGHNWVWRARARSLGIAGDRCAKVEAAQALGIERKRRAKRIVGRCNRCDLEVIRTKALDRNRTYSHRKCGGKIERVD